MRKWILSVAMLAVAAAANAQEAAQEAAQTEGGERSEWLPSFTRIVAEGPFDLELVQVPATEAPRIAYDTKGSYTTKFKAQVKDRVLHIRERMDARRPERTVVRVSFNELESIAVTDAAATLADTLAQPMLDLTLAGTGRLTAALDVGDLEMNESGRSTATLTGRARYLTLYVSGSKFDGTGLEAMSARVNAQSSASVKLWVTDRLEGRTSTGGTIRYKGAPSILRVARKFMAGDIEPLE